MHGRQIFALRLFTRPNVLSYPHQADDDDDDDDDKPVKRLEPS